MLVLCHFAQDISLASAAHLLFQTKDFVDMKLVTKCFLFITDILDFYY